MTGEKKCNASGEYQRTGNIPNRGKSDFIFGLLDRFEHS